MLASLPSQLTTDKKYFNYNRGIELLEQAPYLDKPGKQALNQEARVRRIQEKIKEMTEQYNQLSKTVEENRRKIESISNSNSICDCLFRFFSSILYGTQDLVSAEQLNQEIIELNNKRGELLQTVIQDNKSLEKDYKLVSDALYCNKLDRLYKYYDQR